MLQYLEANPDVYSTIEQSTAQLTANVPTGLSVNRVGSMYTFFFQPRPVKNYDDAKRSDTAAFGRFFHHLLERGVYFPPSQYESGFVSSAHTAADIRHTVNAIADFFSQPGNA